MTSTNMGRPDYRVICDALARGVFAARGSFDNVVDINRMLAEVCKRLQRDYDNFNSTKFCELFWSIYNYMWTVYMRGE